MNKEQAAQAIPDPRGKCDHICLKDGEHVGRGELHSYGYENPSPRALPGEPPWTRERLDALAWTVYDDGGFSDDPDSRYIVIRSLSMFVTALLALGPVVVEGPVQCPTNHMCTLDNQNMIYAVPWRTIIRGQLLKHCPDCGTRLQGGEA